MIYRFLQGILYFQYITQVHITLVNVRNFIYIHKKSGARGGAVS